MADGARPAGADDPKAEPAGEWITVGGEPKPLPSGGSLVALLRSMDIAPDSAGVAVAVNDELVPRARWAEQHLAAGDRIEVVRAVQGG